MKVIKETLDNYPEKATTVQTTVEAEVQDDEKEFDNRAEEVAKEISKPLDKNGTIDGAPKAIKPKPAVVPDSLTESIEESAITEDINEANAGRVIHDVIKNMYGIDVEVATYKDEDESNCVIAQFIVSKEENHKMVYDELKEEIYKRLKDVNISCKQFSSPNLVEKGHEYKLKLFIIKETKDKKRNKRKKNMPKVRKVGQHKDQNITMSNNENLHVNECKGIKITHVKNTAPSTIPMENEPVEEKVLYDSYVDEGFDTAFMHAYTF